MNNVRNVLCHASSNACTEMEPTTFHAEVQDTLHAALIMHETKYSFFYRWSKKNCKILLGEGLKFLIIEVRSKGTTRRGDDGERRSTGAGSTTMRGWLEVWFWTKAGSGHPARRIEDKFFFGERSEDIYNCWGARQKIGRSWLLAGRWRCPVKK